MKRDIPKETDDGSGEIIETQQTERKLLQENSPTKVDKQGNRKINN